MSEDLPYRRLQMEYSEYQAMGMEICNSRIGKYCVFQKIGEGSFGKVYLGMDDGTKYRVALKVIDLHKIKNKGNIRQKEIQTRLSQTQDKLMNTCCSPNIVKCLQVFLSEDLKIIVMEYCNGGTLDQYIKKRGKIPERQATLVIKQIINGIAQMHRHRVIHRDLKAKNIFLKDSQFKIGDLGLSKQLLSEKENALGKHTILGTVSTMAPEVLRKQKYGLKADVWSIGVIFYQLLFGSLPFKSGTKDQILCQVAKKSYLNNQGLSKEADVFLRATLQTDQTQRIGWRQLIKHKLFQSEIRGLELIENISLNVPMERKQQLVPINQTIQFPQKEESELFCLSKLSLDETVMKRQQIQFTEREKSYSQMKVHFHSYLKVELIYYYIITNLSEKQLLNMEMRGATQLMYMLISRCYLDLNDLNSKLYTINRIKDQDPAVRQTVQRINRLNEESTYSWNKYYEKVTNEEDKIVNRIVDFFSTNQQLQIKGKFLNGIQKVSFTRGEHIRFTQNLINPLLGELRSQQYPWIQKLLKNFSEFMLSEASDYGNSCFESYVRKLINLD